MRTFLFILAALFSLDFCMANASDIQISTDTEKLDILLHNIRHSIDISEIEFNLLKKSIERNLDLSPEEYIAYYLQLLDIHSKRLTRDEISDVHYYIAEEVYWISGDVQALQYLHLYPKEETDLLNTHRSFLSYIIYNNDIESIPEALAISLELKPIYEKYNHPNQIRLLSGMALSKGENGFLDDALLHYNLGLERAQEFPGHKFTNVLTINYLYFLVENNLLNDISVSREKFIFYLDELQSSTNKVFQLCALSINLNVADYLKLSSSEVMGIIAKGEEAVKDVSLLKTSHIALNATAEFYKAAAIVLNNRGVEDQLVFKYMDKAIEMFENEVSGKPQLIEAYKIKVETLHRSGRYNELYEAHSTLDSLSSAFHAKDKNEAIAKMSALFKLEEEQLKSSFLEERNRKIYWSMLSLGVALLFTVLLMFSIYRKNQVKQKLNRELTAVNHELNSANSKITDQNKQLFERTDELKEELKNKLFMISTGNDIITLAKKQVDLLEVPFSEKKLIHTYLDQIINSEVVDEVEQQYLKLNQDFTRALTKVHPQLTVNNLKFCILIKAGLSTKAIAQLGFKSTESVKIARSRLRKKLNLSSNEQLFTYFNLIDSQKESSI